MENTDYIYSASFGPDMNSVFKKKTLNLKDDDIVTYDGFDELKQSAGTIALPGSPEYQETAAKLTDQLATAIKDDVFQDSKLNINKVATWCNLTSKFGKDRNFRSKVLDKFKDWKISDILRICYAEITQNGCIMLHITVAKVKISVVIDIPQRRVYVAGVDPAEAEDIIDKLPEKVGLPEDMDFEEANAIMKTVSDSLDPDVQKKGKKDPLYDYLHDLPKGMWTSETIRIARHYSPEFNSIKFLEELTMLTKNKKE